MAEIKFSTEAITELQQTKVYITEELCNERAAVSTVARIAKRIRVLYGQRNLCKSCSGSRATTKYRLTEQTNRHLQRVAIFYVQRRTK